MLRAGHGDRLSERSGRAPRVRLGVEEREAIGLGLARGESSAEIGRRA